MLQLPIHPLLQFVLVRPHYPENVGAAARAMKTMGFTRLVLVKPGKMAEPGHVMAIKMAVKSLDVLEAAPVVPDVKTALADVDFTYATTARRPAASAPCAVAASSARLLSCAAQLAPANRPRRASPR